MILGGEITELTILLALQTYPSLDLVSKPTIEIPPVTVLASHRTDYGEGDRGGVQYGGLE